jgi:hypothetical protein
MNKQYLAYGLVGIIAGLILGFYAGNLASPQPGTTAGTSTREAQSVNSPPSAPQLPPNHPPVTGDVVPAPPLPEGAGGDEPHGSPGAASSSAPAELPSLDPLPASSKEERVEQKYKNIQVLKGIPSERLTKIMFAFKASLGVECTHCHIKDEFEKDDKPAKQMARKMIGIVRDANAKIGTAGRVTCFTCHRGQVRPAS